MKTTRHILVSGTVQGVSYRFFTQREASMLSLCGWVRNLSDGRVEAIVQGPYDKLDMLLEKMEAGPAKAKVKEVSVKEISIASEFTEFKIEEDGDTPWEKK